MTSRQPSLSLPLGCLLALLLTSPGPLTAQETYYVFEGRRLELQRAPAQLSVGAQAGSSLTDSRVRRADQVQEMNGDHWRVDVVDPALAPRATGPSGVKPSASERRQRDTERQEAALAHYLNQPEVTWAYPAYRAVDSGTLLFPTPRIVVQLAAGGGEGTLRANLPPSVRVVRRLRVGSGIFLLELVDPRSSDPITEANRLSEGQSWVAWAEPDFVQDLQKLDTPNDALYPDQWHLNNDGTVGSPPGVAGADGGLEAAWDVETGDGSVVIAIIDDGVQTAHPDLAPRLFTNPGEIPNNGTDDDSNGYVDDVNGWDFFGGDKDPNPILTEPSHGTAVAGVAASAGNNSIGGTGSCRNCKILPVRISGANFASSGVIGEAISYAGSLAHVLNNSWGGGTNSAAINAGILDAVTNGRGGLGSPTLFATGNSASGYTSFTLNGVPTGTWIFEWVFSKDSSESRGLDAGFIDNVVFPDGSVEDFENGIRGADGRGVLPGGWTTVGDASWTAVADETRASSERGGHQAIRSGVITHSQTSGVRVTKTLASANLPLTFEMWSSAETQAGDGEGAPIVDFCYDGTRLNLYNGSNVFQGSWFFTCGTYSNQGNPLQDGVISFPAASPNAIAVGGATNFDRRSDFAQWGPELDFVAHTNGGSAAITTTDITGTQGYSTTSYTDTFGGTSSATPHAAGIVGLYLTANPNATAAQTRAALKAATRQIGPIAYSGGRNDNYGNGVLDGSQLLGGADSIFSDGFESGNTSAWTNKVP